MRPFNPSDYDFDVDGYEIDMASTDRDYLINCKIRVDENLARVREQVTEAKRAHASGEGSSDRDWLRRAEGAIKVLGKASQVIQARLGELKRHFAAKRTEEIREAVAAKNDPKRQEAVRMHTSAWDKAFVDAAREMIPSEKFLELCRVAHRVVGPVKEPPK